LRLCSGRGACRRGAWGVVRTSLSFCMPLPLVVATLFRKKKNTLIFSRGTRPPPVGASPRLWARTRAWPAPGRRRRRSRRGRSTGRAVPSPESDKKRVRGVLVCVCPAPLSLFSLHLNPRTRNRVPTPSSCTILVVQSTMPLYRPDAPWVMSRVFRTSKGVVTTPVIAPAVAPMC
jgi:hypothetical protein